MQIQFTRKHIITPFVIGTMILGIGGFNIQPAVAQADRSAMREMAEELGLSRSQMRQVAGVMQDFKSEIEDILTADQLELLQAAREEMQDQMQDQTQAQVQNIQELKEELDLTEEQTEQLAEARIELVDGLQDVLTAEQIESILEMTILGQL